MFVHKVDLVGLTSAGSCHSSFHPHCVFEVEEDNVDDKKRVTYKPLS